MYIVWHKEDYGDTWTRINCKTPEEVQKTVLDLAKKPGEIEVTTPIDYSISVNLGGSQVTPRPEPDPDDDDEGEEHNKEVPLETATTGSA